MERLPAGCHSTWFCLQLGRTSPLRFMKTNFHNTHCWKPKIVVVRTLSSLAALGVVVVQVRPMTTMGLDWNRNFISCVSVHDDVIKWKYFPRYWPFVWGIYRSLVNSPHNGQWRGALMFSLICAWFMGWVNNREAGDLRRHNAHNDVIVMKWALLQVHFLSSILPPFTRIQSFQIYSRLVGCYVHTSKISLQLKCGETYFIWMRFKWSNMFFGKLHHR